MLKRPLILIADDEPVVAHTLVQILESEGYDATYVSDGAAAVRWARDMRPNIVVCDVIMPTLNGVEAAKQILQCHPSVHVILFSGQAAAAGLVDQAAAEGHQFEVLAKPIKPDLLLQVIAQKLKHSSTITASEHK